MDTQSYTKRVSVYTSKVKFGDGEALLVQSDILRAFIVKNVLSSLLPFDEGVDVLASQFPIYPTDGYISCCFEWISRYTYIQHNYLLYAFKIPDQFDCAEIPITLKIGRKCVAMINKYNYDIYLTNFRFSDEIFNGTLLDGILVKDNCIYPDYFESTFKPASSKLILNESTLMCYNKYLDYHEQHKNDVPYTFNIKHEISAESSNNTTVDGQKDTTTTQKERPIFTDKDQLLKNFNSVTQVIDYNSIFKQQRLPSKHIFYIQAVYQICGTKTIYSTEKLIDSISYKTLLHLQNFLFDVKHWIKDNWLEPFELKNCVDTMYYTRHTQIDLRNPFHNDYLRYHPKNNSFDEMDHFTPKLTDDGRLWKDVYKLSDESFECTLTKSKHPYVYTLTKINNGEEQTAKIMTLEQRRYIRVIINKIHSDRNKPIKIMCKYIKDKETNEIIGWTPIKYG